MSRLKLTSIACLAVVVLCTHLMYKSHRPEQVLPSPFIDKDGIQYFAPGPEFKLSREADAMKAYNAGQAAVEAIAEERGAAVTVSTSPGGNPTADFDFSFTQDSFGADRPMFSGFEAPNAGNDATD